MEKRSIFCIRSDGPYLERFSTFLESIRKEHQVEILKSLDPVASVAEANPTVLLVQVQTPGEVQELTQLLTNAQGPRTKGSLLVVAIQSGLNEKHETQMLKAGCKEVLSDKTELRGLIAKLARHLKIAEQNYAKAAETTQAKVFTGSKSKFAEATTVDLVNFVEPLMLERDYWIVSNKRPAQRNMGRWIITAIGPSPAVGSWSINPKVSRSFIYKVHPSTKHNFGSESGHWVFHGSKPEFSFELGRWSFVGNDPKLEWVDSKGAVTAVKFWHHAESKKLVMAANSEDTLSWLPMIEATFEREYQFRDEGIAAQDNSQAIKARASADSQETERKLGNLVKDIPKETVQFLKDVKTQFQPKTEMFAKLNDNKQIHRFFEVAGNFQDRGMMWLPGRIFLSDLRVHDVNTEAGIAQVIMVPPVLDPLAMIDTGMGNNEDKRVFVNIKLLETSLFFYANREQITCEDGVLSIPIPSSAYEVQRRGGVRLANTPRIKGLAVTKTPPAAKGEWRIIDISPGGVGLEMASDSYAFAKEKPFKIEITMADTVLPLVCMPRWFKPDEMKGKLRVGAQFEHLTKSAQEFLELYIMEKHLERIKQSTSKPTE